MSPRSESSAAASRERFRCSFTGGRALENWFDLVWYLTEKRGLAPNLLLLENALGQTDLTAIDPREWRSALSKRLHDLDWDRVLNDLRPFVERQSDLEQLSPELIEKLL